MQDRMCAAADPTLPAAEFESVLYQHRATVGIKWKNTLTGCLDDADQRLQSELRHNQWHMEQRRLPSTDINCSVLVPKS